MAISQMHLKDCLTGREEAKCVYGGFYNDVTSAVKKETEPGPPVQPSKETQCTEPAENISD